MAMRIEPKGHHSRFKRWLGQLWLRLNGWRVEGQLPDEPRYILIGAPHTSNWDLAFMLAISFVMGFRVHWLGKHTLFRGPVGWLMQRVGGIPVDRSARRNVVDQAVQLFHDHDRLVLAVSPEGTRGRAPHWRSGFYHIAVGARVPIVLGFLDYKRRRGGFGPVLWPSGNIDSDFEKMRRFYATVEGKHPENFGDVQPAPVRFA